MPAVLSRVKFEAVKSLLGKEMREAIEESTKKIVAAIDRNMNNTTSAITGAVTNLTMTQMNEWEKHFKSNEGIQQKVDATVTLSKWTVGVAVVTALFGLVVFGSWWLGWAFLRRNKRVAGLVVSLEAWDLLPLTDLQLEEAQRARRQRKGIPEPGFAGVAPAANNGLSEEADVARDADEDNGSGQPGSGAIQLGNVAPAAPNAGSVSRVNVAFGSATAGPSRAPLIPSLPDIPPLANDFLGPVFAREAVESAETSG